MAMPNLITLGPLLLSVGLLIALVQFRELNPRLVRALCAALCVFVSLRYIWWRFEYSMPFHQNDYQQAWAWIFFAFETMSIVSSTTVLLFMSRHKHREPPARAPAEITDAPVDVFIATYNEPLQILERTIVGAKAIDHRDLRVWVLDDGARDWVRDLAAELGAHYVRRVKGAHAKAGNVNNGLEHALQTGRKPQFILLLDADFVPYRNILKRTLGFFIELDVGIVQTPQHFFNPDPIQSNLLVARHWPDEQRFFFNTLLACKDAWGAAFCCGTSAVFRVDALVAAGGMAIETVTEDMLTSFKFGEFGYRTIFLNERLSMGLAPEGLAAYVSQRARWCLGAMQQLYTRWSFAGQGKVNLINRISALDGVLYWMSSAPFKLMMISGPLVYWWTATSVISSTIDDLLRYLAPSVICSLIFMGYYAHKRIIPVMTDVTHLLASFTITATVALALVRPWGHPFKVTAKGVASDRIVVQWGLLAPFAALAVATILGIALNISQYSPLYGTDGYEVNVFWSVFNILVLVIACAVCIELPRRRSEERFESGEQALVRLNTGMQAPCMIRDISLGGANISLGIGRLRANDEGALVFADGVEAPFQLVRELPGGFAVKFAGDAATRRSLIAKLFTGRYANEVPQIRVGKVFTAVGRRLAA
jgi:cellulose synthase (UDP-forming)